ncbi:MAG4270 family putative restriction endonuclease [Candidatus Mycoplasma mahonii]|uniref:MAG4270 family putative restriction endonuclease n=1 Tax=Candidatus Mycoplasma mahonii TaxID=3004105 RepID=UPI0026EA773E|nr:HNH endonuclease [Candidatus Mycoplasma mahonii]WKX02759.1 HNH endonuclease [Candidatus Mycoplasma mahonii]
MVCKISFINKAVNSNRLNRSTKIQGDIYFKYSLKNNFLKIEGAKILLNGENEFNEHQQSTWSKSKGLRQKFTDKFNKFNHLSKTKKLIGMSDDEILWWNNKMSTQGSVLSISGYLSGNNPTGSQQDKLNGEFIIKSGNNENFQFINLLRVFTDKRTLKSSDFDYSNHITFEQFLNNVRQIDKYKFVIDNWFSKSYKFFYIDEMRSYLRINDISDSTSRLRNEFRNVLISTFDRKDHLYKIFKAMKMVEAAHIKPVSHISSEYKNEIKDINNGLLLSPDIHKLFDSGAITFNDRGSVVYSTNKNHEPFNLSKEEVQRLELDNYKLDGSLLNDKRLGYLKYHRENVYKKGV